MERRGLGEVNSRPVIAFAINSFRLLVLKSP
jgi:hypothetical protein